MNPARTMVRAVMSLHRAVSTCLTRILFRAFGIGVGSGFRSFGLPHVRRMPRGRIAFGSNVTLMNSATGNPLGLAHCCIFITGPTGVIEVGNNCGFSGVAINAFERVTIGNFVLVGANAKIFDNDFHPVSWKERRNPQAKAGFGKPIVIEDDVFIGAGAMILKGVTIGRGAIIGAGAVVTKSIPAFTVWAGNPARQVSQLPEG